MVSDRSTVIYRSAVVAIVGLTLVGGDQPSKGEVAGEQPRATSGPPRSDLAGVPEDAKIGVKAAMKLQPCAEGKYRSNDDLCAQWKAADAAAESARWSFWQFILSALGVLGLGFTLFFNYRALRLAELQAEETKDALTIAARSADAAVSLAEQAEKTADRQLRPYVFVTDAVLGATENDGIAINISYKNFGATPACGVTIKSGVAVVRLPVEFPPPLDNDASCARVIAPNQQIETSAFVEAANSFRDALSQSDCIILRTKITYEIKPGVIDSDDQTVIMDIENLSSGRFRFPLEGEILNP